MYGDAGYLYVMLYAEYLSAQGKKVLVVDRSEEKSIQSRLPLPKESMDCLYYQGVDYLITAEKALLPYDSCLYYWGETSPGRRQEATKQGSVRGIVITNYTRPRLDWGIELALKQDVLLVAEVPEAGCIKKLLRQKQIRLPEGQLIELPWRLRDAKALFALEHGRGISFRKLSKELRQLLRYLSEKTKEEVEIHDCSLLE